MILTPASTIAGSLEKTAATPDDDIADQERHDRLAATAQDCIAQHRQLQLEVARYIEMLLGELATMARAADLKPLMQFLEATRSEAGLAMTFYRTER
jgi:hypothetical protein